MYDKKWTVFMIDHKLKSMTRYCEHDERYEFKFEANDGKTEVFLSSRKEVAERYGDESKDDSVRHFEDMAMAWFAEKMQNIR